MQRDKDGNEYALKALEAGAAYAVVNASSEAAAAAAEGRLPADVAARLVVVEDTLKTLQELARWHRSMTFVDGKPLTVVALTGTNGKTTTTTLVGKLMKNYFDSVFVVGNIGNPYTEAAKEMVDETVTVAEISSFQLETIHEFHPVVSAILNITPDHLNRHHTMENYAGAKEAIADMKKAGVRKTVMLTGDRREAALSVANELGIDEVHANLLPADKVEKVEKLLEQLGGKEKLAFVGDGINDAPVLTRADVGIAMGSLGQDAAIEAADVVLMDDDIGKISSLIGISRKTIHIVKQNIVFALGVKLVVLLLGALGFANMWAAVFADVGVTLIAVLNSIRIIR